MNSDKRKLYIVTAFALILSFFALILPLGRSLYPKLLFVLLSCALVLFFVKKKSAKSIYKNQLFLLMTVTALLFVVLIYMSGLRFGFITTVAGQQGVDVFGKVIPTLLIIIATELIRSTLLAQGNKLVSIITYFTCLFTEVGISVVFGDIASMNAFMDAVGLTIIPAVSANLLSHYISKDYGALPVISYRIIMSLYPLILATRPIIPDALLSAAGTILPLLIILFVRMLYTRKQPKRENRKKKLLYYVSMGVSAALMISLVMIISCEFRYCALVIATESMTGEINKGDAAVYEKYDDQVIEEGQVIVFKDGNARIVHRVVEITNINGVARYYTKGDANDSNDYGYRTDEDVEGVVLFKVSYIGYPTLLLAEAFKE